MSKTRVFIRLVFNFGLVMLCGASCQPNTCDNGADTYHNLELSSDWIDAGDEQIALKLTWDEGRTLGDDYFRSAEFTRSACQEDLASCPMHIASLRGSRVGQLCLWRASDPERQCVANYEKLILTGTREYTAFFPNSVRELFADDAFGVYLVILPDRRSYTNCNHAGMDDRYLLQATIRLDGEGNMRNKTLVETVMRGPA